MALAVFYTPRMVADAGSFSPSAAKPAQVVADWQARGLDIEVVEPVAATVEQLCRAHDRALVEGVLAGTVANGFGNTSAAVAATLPLTSGAMLAAARHALANRTIACAPVSGFHHARYRTCGAFCTFNGLMVTACALHHEDGVGRVGILDYDMHEGDGTDDIIDVLDARAWVTHITAGAHYFDRTDRDRLLVELRERIRALAGCDIVLYQAGADQHVDDPLGGILTTEELRWRDDTVFTTVAATLHAPIAWNLAGGYQKEADGSIPKVLAVHANTAEVAITALRYLI